MAGSMPAVCHGVMEDGPLPIATRNGAYAPHCRRPGMTAGCGRVGGERPLADPTVNGEVGRLAAGSLPGAVLTIAAMYAIGIRGDSSPRLITLTLGSRGAERRGGGGAAVDQADERPACGQAPALDAAGDGAGRVYAGGARDDVVGRAPGRPRHDAAGDPLPQGPASSDWSAPTSRTRCR